VGKRNDGKGKKKPKESTNLGEQKKGGFGFTGEQDTVLKTRGAEKRGVWGYKEK